MSNTPETTGGDADKSHEQSPPNHESSWVTALEEGFEEIKSQPADVLFVDVLKIDLPYIIMLSMAVFGIGLVTFTGEPIGLYWEVLTIVYCAPLHLRRLALCADQAGARQAGLDAGPALGGVPRRHVADLHARDARRSST